MDSEKQFFNSFQEEKSSSEKPAESAEEKNQRFSEGKIAEEEICEYWKNPDKSFFEHEIIVKKGEKEEKILVRMYGLTEKIKEPFLREMEATWDSVSYWELEEEIESCLNQQKLDHPCLSNSEHYILTDRNDRPIGITGIYSSDIQGGAGLKTKEFLDLDKHNLIVQLGWYAVTKPFRRKKVEEFLLDWTEEMAKSRGAKIITTDTSDFPDEKAACQMYEKRGYKQGFDVKDYYGPGRDLAVYFDDISKQQIEEFFPSEQISSENRLEILELAKSIYSPERYREFEVCLDLFLKQKDNEFTIDKGLSFILREEQNKPDGFAILSYGIYENAIYVDWEGATTESIEAKKKLIKSIRGIAKMKDIDIIVVSREGSDDDFIKEGFQLAKESLGPQFFGKEDESRFLFYTKRL